MIPEDKAYYEIKITEGLRLTHSVFSGECNGSINQFGGIRLGKPIWNQIDIASINEQDVFDDTISKENQLDPFMGRSSLTWFLFDDRSYVSLSRLGRYNDELLVLNDEYSMDGAEVAPNVLYCPSDDSVITKSMELRKGDYLDSEYVYTLHKLNEKTTVDVEKIYPIPDSVLLGLLPEEYSSEILSIVI